MFINSLPSSEQVLMLIYVQSTHCEQVLMFINSLPSCEQVLMLMNSQPSCEQVQMIMNGQLSCEQILRI